MVLGIAAGLAVGSIRLLRDVLNPFVVALYGIPKILVLPWIVLLLGYGTAPAIFYGTLHGLFPVLVLVIGAVRDVDRTLVTVARSYGATTWQLYWKVLLPAIVPSVFAGMRLGIVFCLLGVLVVEMFAGIRGMGYVMGALANGFQAPELFAATGLVSAASIAIVLGTRRERHGHRDRRLAPPRPARDHFRLWHVRGRAARGAQRPRSAHGQGDHDPVGQGAALPPEPQSEGRDPLRRLRAGDRSPARWGAVW